MYRQYYNKVDRQFMYMYVYKVKKNLFLIYGV